jgi:hypothetical protein
LPTHRRNSFQVQIYIFIIAQSRDKVNIYSAPGRVTAFTFYKALQELTLFIYIDILRMFKSSCAKGSRANVAVLIPNGRADEISPAVLFSKDLIPT